MCPDYTGPYGACHNAVAFRTAHRLALSIAHPDKSHKRPDQGRQWNALGLPNGITRAVATTDHCTEPPDTGAVC